MEPSRRQEVLQLKPGLVPDAPADQAQAQTEFAILTRGQRSANPAREPESKVTRFQLGPRSRAHTHSGAENHAARVRDLAGALSQPAHSEIHCESLEPPGRRALEHGFALTTTNGDIGVFAKHSGGFHHPGRAHPVVIVHKSHNTVAGMCEATLACSTQAQPEFFHDT